MKTLWKVLGFAALAAGLTPYKVDKNEETGENSYQALLWHGSIKPGEGEGKREVLVNFGEGTLTGKVLDAIEKKKEAHLFSDELSVDYHSADEEDAADAGEAVTAAEDAAAEAEDAVAAVTEDAAAVVEDAAAEDAADVAEDAADAVEDAAADAEVFPAD